MVKYKDYVPIEVEYNVVAGHAPYRPVNHIYNSLLSFIAVIAVTKWFFYNQTEIFFSLLVPFWILLIALH